MIPTPKPNTLLLLMIRHIHLHLHMSGIPLGYATSPQFIKSLISQKPFRSPPLNHINYVLFILIIYIQWQLLGYTPPNLVHINSFTPYTYQGSLGYTPPLTDHKRFDISETIHMPTSSGSHKYLTRYKWTGD